MNKLTLLTCATSVALLASTNVSANGKLPAPLPAVQASSSMNALSTGFYGGVAGGYQNLKTKFQGTYNDGLGLNNSVFPFRGTGSKSKLIGEAFAGGHRVFSNNFVLGTELAVLFGSTKTTKNFAQAVANPPRFRFNGERSWALIPSVVTGYKLQDNIMAYIKWGVAVSKFKVSGVETTPGANPVFPFSRKKTMIGLAPAIGFAYGLNSHLFLRTELGAEFYGSSIKANSNLDPATADSIRSKMEPTVYNVKVGLAYKF